MPKVGPGVQEALIGIFLETLLYGAFFVVSWDCARALRQRMLSGNTHWYMLGTFVALFIFITMRVIVDLKRTIVSFSYPSDTGAIDLGAPASVESLMTNLLLVLITVTADMFLVYRIFIVWKRNFLIIIVPILLCMGTAGGGAYVVYCLANAVPKNGIAAYLRIAKAFSYFLYFTLAANIVGTILIAGRIWWIRRNSARNRGSDAVTHIVTLIVESAAIYSAVLIAEITVIAVGSHADFLFINLIGPLVGIVFGYIIIRASSSSGSSSRAETSRGHVSGMSGGYSVGAHPSQFARSGGHHQYDNRPRNTDDDVPVQIRLETIVHTDSEMERDKY